MLSEALAKGELGYSKIRALTRIAMPGNEADLLNIGLHGTAQHVEKFVRLHNRAKRAEDAVVDERLLRANEPLDLGESEHLDPGRMPGDLNVGRPQGHLEVVGQLHQLAAQVEAPSKPVIDQLLGQAPRTRAEPKPHRTVPPTRKSAISARAGELGIVPGSMGAHSYIARGRGNAESFHSRAHGAGRVMSRGAAKRQFTTADLEEQTAGIECRKDAGVIDEIPSAYKPIDEVMDRQNDLAEPVYKLRQVLNIKG